MKTVFEGDIINVLTVESGLVIAYACEKTDEKMEIAYKMVTFDDGKLTNVPRSLYHISKFGPNFAAIRERIKTPITCKALNLPNGKVFTVETDGTAMLHDTDGGLIWKGVLSYKGASPSGIAVNNRSIWVCYEQANVLIRLNLLTMKEELRIGGGEASPFKAPIDLFTDSDNIYVCSKELNGIVKVNLNTYVTSEYKTFDRPVLQYIKNGPYEFAALQNGVYLID